MAVIQISKIQVRRGLQENLPQLAGGEFGWSVDEGRLWIGNGTLTEGAPEEGNTEILTVRNDRLPALRYSFVGDESGYISKTHPNPSLSVIRTIQHKLDDFVNFRDFIKDDNAREPNPNYDYTETLQRAIDQTFPNGYDLDINAGVRRVLRIPAGRWQISNITVPPYATIVGEGKASTILYANIAPHPSAVGVVTFRDSQGNIGSQTNTLTSSLPSNVSISGLSVSLSYSGRAVTLENCNNMKFEDVGFFSGNTVPVDVDISKPRTLGQISQWAWSVAMQNTVADIKNISFENCSFRDGNFGIITVGQGTHITVSNCDFENLTYGVFSEGLGVAPRVTITQSYFNNIAKNGIYAVEYSSVISSFNSFDRVGFGNATVIDSLTPSHSVFYYDSSANYSFGDLIDRTQLEEEMVPIYEVINPGPDQLRSFNAWGTALTSAGYSDLLEDGATLTSQIYVHPNQSSVIDYRISRGAESRIGTIKITHLGGSPNFDEEYTESADIAVTTSWTTSGNSLVLEWSSISVAPWVGLSANISYQSKSFV